MPTGSSGRRVTVVIPVVETHDRYIPEVLESISSDRDVIDSVVLARSGLPDERVGTYQRFADQLSLRSGIPLDVASTRRRMTAGLNRNRGWALSKSPYTAFIDADDLYVPRRLTKMLSVADKFSSNLVLHDYWGTTGPVANGQEEDWAMSDVISSEQLMKATFPHGRNRRAEGSVPGDTNIIIPDWVGENRTAHPGHVLVRTDIRERVVFGPRYPGEDGQFCRDVLWDLGSVHYIPARLSIYRRELSAERESTILDKIHRRVHATRDLGLRALNPWKM